LGGIVAYLVHYGVSMAILVPRGFANGGDNLMVQALRLGLAGLMGLMTYWWFGSRLNVPEFAQVTGMVQRKLRR
jgi:hypothetical protein